MTIDEMIAVLQAAKAGKRLQHRWRGGTDWHDSHHPENFIGFDTYDFRVKPEPREFWVVLCGNHMSVTDVDKPAHCPKCLEIIKVREVLS